MSKYLEYFDGAFDSTVAEKLQPENWPYVAYSKTEGIAYTIVPKEEGYTVMTLKKVDISNISYEEVDLGLPSGLKWANKNIGAQTEEDYGTYFSWGNTVGYTVSGTKFLTVDEVCQLFSDAFGTPITNKEELDSMLAGVGISLDKIGIIDGYSFDDTTYNGTSGFEFSGDILDSAHDAAALIMGDSWRIPTVDEYKELVNAVKASAEDNENPLTYTCIYLDKEGNRAEYVVYRGSSEDGILASFPEYSCILGSKFTNDSTGASVYFPSCGTVQGSSLLTGLEGSYWSSSFCTPEAHRFYFVGSYVVANHSSERYYGMCVRAVK